VYVCACVCTHVYIYIYTHIYIYMCTICLERCAGVLVEFVMIVGFLDERWIQLH